MKNKTCEGCMWLHEFPFYEDWHSCLLPNKYDKIGVRKFTKISLKKCFYKKLKL